MSKQRLPDGEPSSREAGDDDTVEPQSCIIVRFNPKINQNALEWLVGKIMAMRRDGGAELIACIQPYNPKEGVVLHVSASKIKFLEVAEEMELTKTDKSGRVREFVVSDLEEFLPEGMYDSDLLTVAEKQTIIRHELENIRALAEDHHIPGYPSHTLYEGQSIIHVALQYKLIKKIYPLHDQEALKKLGGKWYLSLFRKQPFEEIRLYFGESVALYFTFIGFYTTALLFPMVLGFFQLLVSTEAVPFFCIFNVVWVTVFLETWRRKSNELAFQWGTIGMTSLDEPRASFRGQMGIDPVSGRTQPQYPRWKTNAKMYLVSIPIVLLCMGVAFIIMLASFWIEDYLKNYDHPWAQQAVSLPSIIYTGIVYILNVQYRKLATRLTEWENHRTQSQYDRHRVTKLVLFEFVNNFLALFYIAFIIQDLEMLKSQLATMLIILQSINHIQEAILPLLIKFYITKTSQSSGQSDKRVKLPTAITPYTPPPVTGPRELDPDDESILSANTEGKLDYYEDVYDDYLEMFIQFGYVVLFSSVYPLAAFWAVVNNVLEIRADAFKLCMVYKRPMSKRVKDIGAWQKAFEIMGALSILTNCALLCMTPQIDKMPYAQQGGWILKFVLLEHCLLGIRYLLHISIPEKPEWVRVALARRNFESKQALKNEQMQKSRRILTRRFRSVPAPHSPHGDS